MNSKKRYIGVDKPQVERHHWWQKLTPRQAFSSKYQLTAEQQDNIDYDPGFDEDWDPIKEEE